MINRVKRFMVVQYTMSTPKPSSIHLVQSSKAVSKFSESGLTIIVLELELELVAQDLPLVKPCWLADRPAELFS